VTALPESQQLQIMTTEYNQNNAPKELPLLKNNARGGALHMITGLKSLRLKPQ